MTRRWLSAQSASLLLTGSLLTSLAMAQGSPLPNDGALVHERLDGTIVAADDTGTFVFNTWNEYFQSPFFQNNGMRCGELERRPVFPNQGFLGGGAGDCTNSSTNPSAGYDPGVVLYRVPVVVHVIQNTSGSGFLGASKIQSQIDILNEDFLAILGSNGAPGTDCQIEFYLATEDPNGNSTTGITYTTNNNWYNDSGNFQGALHWDTNRYLNIYTNTAGGYLGYAYVPNGGGVVGNSFDGVVCNWTAFGRNAIGGPPYNQGRTATHEVGHYLGLFHTFDGGCGTNSCYTTGDLICDTEKEANPRFGCNPNNSSCSSPDPVRNYMDYTDDLCMWEFTPEQARRMRCTLEHWRVDLWTTGGGGGGGNDPLTLFADGFESGNFTAGGWYLQNNKPRIHAKADRTGTYGARLRRTTWIMKNVSTVGHETITVKFSRRTRNFDAGEQLTVEWYDGFLWNTIETVNTTQWADQEFVLPAAAENNAQFQLRFRTNGNVNNERADVDDVEVIGTPI